MELWMERVAAILDDAPARALPLSRLLSEIREQGEVVTGREAWILQRIRERPDRFRVIPDRLGPWNLWPEPSMMPVNGRTLPGPTADPWIVTSSTARSGFGAEGRFVGTVQETLQAWGWSVDVGSQVAIARWIRAHKEGEKAVAETQGIRPLEGDRISPTKPALRPERQTS